MSANLYTIFTKSNCSFCTKVKELLRDQQTEEVNCDNILLTNRERFLAEMKQRIGYEYKTFPMVFLNDRFIGGYTDTVKYLELAEAFDEQQTICF
jgi:glutaredoxin